MHHRATDENTAFERKLRPAVRLRRTGRDQAVGRSLELRTGMHQQETAGSISDLGQTRLETGLTEQRCLLIAGDAADGDFATEMTGLDLAIAMRRRMNLGQH